jgi:hypothetical protein
MDCKGQTNHRQVPPRAKVLPNLAAGMRMNESER